MDVEIVSEDSREAIILDLRVILDRIKELAGGVSDAAEVHIEQVISYLEKNKQ